MPFGAVTFDVGGVLKTTSVSSLRAWEARFGLPKGGVEEAIYYDPACQRAMTGKGSVADIWASVQQHFSLSAEEFELLKADYVDTMRSLAWDMELLDFIGTLRPRHKTGLISNGFPGQRESLERQIGSDTFDVMVLSAEEGVLKPGPEIYRRALLRLGVAAEQTIFVDDMLRNVDGARAVGIHAILYTDSLDVRDQVSRLLGI
jgi:epoxide hydrolase-like predicted phosphatase